MSKILSANKSFLIEVSGTVQGLGFRPFVFNLAVSSCLTGFVRNTGGGAQIIVSGSEDRLKNFVSKLEKSDFNAKYKIKKILSAEKYKNFRIIKSKKSEILSDFPHDLAMCDECKKELFSSSDRRRLYPFINCIKCGPRFSIIKKLPYDRKNTTMSKFAMCSECKNEYNNPSNRRFHAQPNACHKCGPQLSLFNSEKKYISRKNKALSNAVKLLKKGKILAVKSIGGYHLCCDASNPKAVKLLRKRKNRPFKPFAVMADIEQAGRLCLINEYEKTELLSDKAPIVLLNKKRHSEISEMLAPRNACLGIMMPYAPLHHLLIKEVPVIVMTSGNKSDEPICINEKEAFFKLSGIADYFLTHDRKIENRLDDSIIRFLPDLKEKVIIRRSRGYVPAPVKTGIKAEIFAAGGDLKNNFCFIRKGNAYLSQYTGDLSENENLNFYDESVKKMRSFLSIKPKTAVCDAHPGYYSSGYASEHYKNAVFAQHHRAHMASVMAEHDLKGDLLGFIFDGNGYGEDGNIWGGEIFLYSNKKFARAGHFDYFHLPGGEICSLEIWRAAVSLLHKYGFLDKLPAHLKKYKYKTAVKMIESGVNSPLTSSAGRIFDAVAALAGIRDISTFEAEAAVALESEAYGCKTDSYYEYDIKNGIIGIKKILKGILNDIQKDVLPTVISAKFHNTIADIIVNFAKKHKIKNIALGGGVFQNIYLLCKTRERLLSSGFNIYYNMQVPVNDGGICLGQAFLK